MRTMSQRYQSIIFLVIVVVLGLSIFFWLSKQLARAQLSSLEEPIALTGSFVCVPEVVEKISSDESCIDGIKTPGGEQYVLDVSGIPEKEISKARRAKKITVEGMVTPAEALSEVQKGQYDVEGVIRAFTVKTR